MTADNYKPGTEVALPGRPQPREITGGAVGIEDIKRRAEYIRELAVEGAKEQAEQAVDQVRSQSTQIIVAVGIGFVVAVGIAYFVGRSTAKRLSEPWCPPGCSPDR